MENNQTKEKAIIIVDRNKGLNKVKTKALFNRAKEQYQNEYDVINSVYEIIGKDSKCLADCDCIILQNGWENEKGMRDIINEITDKKIIELVPNRRDLLKAILTVGCVSEEDFKAQKRNREFVNLRQIYSYIRRRSGVTYANIGEETNRTHCTIIHENKAHRWDVRNIPAYTALYKEVLLELTKTNKYHDFLSLLMREVQTSKKG